MASLTSAEGIAAAAVEKLCHDASEGTYRKVALASGQEAAVRARLAAFVAAVAGEDDETRRARLPRLRGMVHDATAYVEASLPQGVGRVDGYCVGPILEALADETLAALPAVKEAPAILGR